MYNMKTMKITAFSLILVMFVSGCSVISSAGYQNTQPIDAITDFRVPDKLDEPKEGKGAVFGVIDSSNLIDLRGNLVYLGELVELPDNMYGAFLNTKDASSSLIDVRNGKFFVTNVAPGRYSLIIYEVMEGGKVYKDDNGSAVVVIVEENRITDVGHISYPLINQ